LITVKDFMTKPPRTISPGAKVSEAVRIMAEKSIGSVIVAANGKPKGILTERDLVSKVAEPGRDPGTLEVGEVASRQIAEVEPGTSLKQAAKTMISKKGRLLVLENGRLVGIVTATDIVRAVHKQGTVFDPSTTISRNIVTVKPETSIREVVGIMNRRRVGSVIVTKDGKPFGIFTERDLVKKVLSNRSSLDRPVGNLATKRLIIARGDTDGRGATGIMASKGIRRLLLLDDGAMSGVITARDLVEAYAVS
jgi:CBS domain-containing protein